MHDKLPLRYVTLATCLAHGPRIHADLSVAVRHQDFLLERALFNRHKQDSSRLVASAKSLLALVIKAYSLRDLCWQFKCDLTDTVPSAFDIPKDLF